MDLRKVKKLIELFEDSKLVEIEIAEGDNRIRLSRGIVQPPITAAAASPLPTAPAAQSANDSPAATADAPTGEVVVSPLVGTFYDAPSPQDKPYVTLGSVVKVGDTLCLIEAMKTFNQVEAEIAGVVSAIHKRNGDPVEYGEPVFVIERAPDAND